MKLVPHSVNKHVEEGEGSAVRLFRLLTSPEAEKGTEVPLAVKYMYTWKLEHPIGFIIY